MPQHGITMWARGLHVFPLPLVSPVDRERDGKDTGKGMREERGSGRRQ